LTYHGFITEEKLAAVLIKPSLGVSNWPVIYIINYTPAKHQQVFWHHSTPRHQVVALVLSHWSHGVEIFTTLRSATSASSSTPVWGRNPAFGLQGYITESPDNHYNITPR
jgi:hypothetical protein